MKHIHWFRTRERGSWIKTCRCGLLRLGALEWSDVTAAEMQEFLARMRRPAPATPVEEVSA